MSTRSINAAGGARDAGENRRIPESRLAFTMIDGRAPVFRVPDRDQMFRCTLQHSPSSL
jgi:hypothetical protein